MFRDARRPYEARLKQNKLSGAIDDLNSIRIRAGLVNIPQTLSQSEVAAALVQERRIELFCEWGHRWFDLKRSGQANTVLQPLKPGWTSNAQLWPLPTADLINDPNLTQNAGY